MRVADGYDSAIIGYAYNPISRKNVVVYEVEKILKILFERDGMSLDDAEEFFNFNNCRLIRWGADTNICLQG